MSKQNYIQQEMRRLKRSMDFISQHPALDKPGQAGRALAEIYQQLGGAWELLALQCRHRAGWRKLKDGGQTCKTCGTLKGTKERWLLLPRTGSKVIGNMIRPTTKQVQPGRKVATVVKDTVMFHGAKLEVEVLNPHRSALFRQWNVTVAADRLVKLPEGNVTCQLDDHMLPIRFGRRRRGAEPPFSEFVSELPRRVLKKFPVMVETDRRGRFVGLVVFKPGTE